MTFSNSTTIAALEHSRVLPVVTLSNADHARGVGEALVRGGLTCAEFTMRTPTALRALESAASVGGLRVGAGTVLSPQDVNRCVDVGASFIVSPGFDPEVVETAIARGVLAIPGVATPTEVQSALRYGLTHLKLFPASSLGGLQYISQICEPFPNVQFLPSGGVTLTNAVEFLKHDQVFAVSGSWMVPRLTLDAGDFRRIEELVRVTAEMIRR